jgi:hypothetical protein
MGWFGRLVIEALRETQIAPDRRPPEVRIPRQSIEVTDLGEPALVEIALGDVDGQGTPGVQLELMHELMDRPEAVAMSGAEAEATAKALWDAAQMIQPHERFVARHRRRE